MKFDKKRLYPIILILLIFVVYKYRESKTLVLQSIEGETMGTTYHIKYISDVALKNTIDSILIDVNNSLSTYISNSEISKFNKNGSLEISSLYFYPVAKKSLDIFKRTNGAFDPTVMPLVNAWGFGFKNKSVIDSNLIDSLLLLVDFNKIEFDEKSASSLMSEMMLDFSAIAKGYGVDVIADFLKSKNIKNYMIEIGGEVVCSGVNEKKNSWKIGIDNPKFQEEGGEQLAQIIELNNLALATSGNYRNYYKDKNGVKRTHTLDPKTGYPVNHSLLSASVKAKDCMTADGYATALMVLGLEKGKELSHKVEEIEIFLIFDDNGKLGTWSSEGFFE